MQKPLYFYFHRTLINRTSIYRTLIYRTLIYRTLFILYSVLASAHLYAAEIAVKNVSTKNIVAIQNAWVRSTNAGQSVGAAYMTLTSPQNITLLRIESDAAKNVEIHQMSMQAGVMKMRMLDTLPLIAGKPYVLAPGGFHLMLFDLKKPLNEGEQVNFVLYFSNEKDTKKPLKTTRASIFKQSIPVMVKALDNAGNGH